MSALNLIDIIKSILNSQLFYTLMRLLLGIVFIFAGISKLFDPRSFARTISAYGIVPEALLVPVATALPALEFTAGACLLLNIRGSVEVITGLLVLFLIVLGYAILHDLDVDCGCYAGKETPTPGSLKVAFARDLGMTGISLYLITWRRFNRGLRAWSNQSSN